MPQRRTFLAMCKFSLGSFSFTSHCMRKLSEFLHTSQQHAIVQLSKAALWVCIESNYAYKELNTGSKELCMLNKLYISEKIRNAWLTAECSYGRLLGVEVLDHTGELAELRSFLMPFNSRRKALKQWNQIQVHSLLPILKTQAVKVIRAVGVRNP